MQAVTLYTTWPDADTAEGCALALVEQKLAACCTLLPSGLSVYRWRGGVQRDSETVLLVKTVAARADAARALILALHPYELPCVAAWPISASESHAPYLAWIAQETLGGGER